MSEDPMKVPLPIIIFLSSLIACLIVLCIIYQLLKRDKCCQIHGREGGDEEEIQPFITEENENQETGQADTTADNTAEDIVTITSSAVEQTDGVVKADDTTIDLSLSGASFPSIDLLPVEEEEPVSTSGSLLLETTFSPVAKKMTISVVRAANIPGPERGGTSMVQVHLTILPNRRFKFRTRLKPAESPVFNEKFSLYPVTVETLEEMSMRVRLYGKTRFSKKVLGELEILFTEIDLHSDLSDEPMWKTLLPYGMVAKLAALRELHMEEEAEEEMG